jgi:hypothetical protein
MNTEILIIVLAAAAVAVMWFMVARARREAARLNGLYEISVKSREGDNESYRRWREKMRTKGEEDMAAMRGQLDTVVREGVKGMSWHMCFDVGMRKLFKKHDRDEAEIGALKASLEKARRDAEATKSFIEGMTAGTDSLHEKIAQLEAEAKPSIITPEEVERLRKEIHDSACGPDMNRRLTEIDRAFGIFTRWAFPVACEPGDAVMGVLEKFAGELDIAVVNPATGEARKLDA